VAVGAVLALRLPAPKTNSLDSPPIYDVC
jgi:hypothetical protein